MRRLAVLAVVALALAGVVAPWWTTGHDPSTAAVAAARRPVSAAAPDALQRRVLAELAVFTRWLDRAGALGYVGEVGWPGDDPRWNALAARWYAEAAAADLWVTAWSAGAWWGCADPLVIFCSPDGVDVGVARPQAAVLAEQRSAWRGGVNLNGGEFGVDGTGGRGDAPTARFSNERPGTYGRDYEYPSAASFAYVAANGVRLVRLPFRWERVQPRPGGPLDAGEVARLSAAVRRAGDAGVRVVLDLHNYGAYYLEEGGGGVRRPVGSRQLTDGHFADLWSRLSGVFAGEPAVAGYGLMNEPNGTPGGAAGWERATQAAVDAIRARGDRTVVLVPGYRWSSVVHFEDAHPGGPWIDDPLGRVRYEAHQYFDLDLSGAYARSYDAEVRAAEARGHGGRR